MGNDPTTTRGTGGTGLTRRTFLGAGGAVFGSALLLGPNAPSRSSRPSALARLATQGGPRLPLAYVRDTGGITAAELRSLLAAGGAQALPAVQLRSGGAPAGGGA